MCGIAGFSGRFDETLLRAMGGMIAHRGPDDRGQLLIPEEGIGLVHRRLSIIDLSPAGRQPMWDRTGTAAITFNGEIYNYRELRNELLAAGRGFTSESDTEVILEGYLVWGEKVLKRLNGIFAFALWDSRRKRLLLARDGFGVKPLYLVRVPRGTVFASEMKSLFLVKDLDTSIDEGTVYHHLALGWSPSPLTMLRSVRKLEPGHAVWLREGETEEKWQFHELPFGGPKSTLDEEQAAEEVAHALDEAVRRQLVADVPVGAFLSGGVDSSAVVAMARRHRGDRPMKCFTIAYRDGTLESEGFADDLPYARRVAAHLGQELVEVEVGAPAFERIDEMIYHLDEPQPEPAGLSVLLISEAAKRHGIKVLLSGAGGDDVFSGYRRHYALSLERYWSWLPRPMRAAVAGATSGLPVGAPALRRIRKAFQFAGAPPDRRLAGYFLWLDPAWLRRLLPAADALLAEGAVAPVLERTLRGLPGSMSRLDRMLFLDCKFYLTDYNLNFTDKMSMAAGVEVRVPFLDPDLVRVAAALPDGFRQRGGEGKWLLRKAVGPLLPPEVLTRPKTGFTGPLRHWLRAYLRSAAERILAPGVMGRRGLFCPEAVSRLVRATGQGRVDGSYTLFALICIELWCQRFLDRRPGGLA